jgi:MoxR-like ATPase
LEPEEVAARAQQVVQAVEAVIMGKNEVVSLAVAVILAKGHLLIEDIPGVGKTTLARALAAALGLKFKRIQFTPDLLPSDITGSSVFNQKTSEFEVRTGPVFANVVLADEINRTTPKTQAALLECMEESNVTIDGASYSLPSPFFVIATQNNIEMAGTYPLPEAQLDRFMARIAMGYPGRQAELQILDRRHGAPGVDSIQPVTCGPEIVQMQAEVLKIHVDDVVQDYLLDIVDGTRNHSSVLLGASPRGSLALLHTSQALAALEGRSFVKPDDVKRLARLVLPHRIIVRPEQRMRGLSADTIVDQVLQQVPAPVAVNRR